jgi:predicted dehydrogenase
VTSTHAVRFAAVGLDHAHIFGQITGLVGAGAEFVGMATDDPSAAIATRVRELYPEVPVVESPDDLISRDGIDLIVTAAVPDRRGPIAVAALCASAAH